MKTLIWIEKLLERSGGPPTYVYNLRKSVVENNLNDEIKFHPDLVPSIFAEGKKSKIAKNFLLALPKVIRVNLSILRYLRMLNKDKERTLINDVSQYDFIHFHSTVDLFRNSGTLKNFKGKILLTPHSPKVFHLEIIEDVLNSTRDVVVKKIFKKLVDIDTFAFNRADVLIFPCEGALEPYYNSWKEFSKNINENKLRFLLTACPQPKVVHHRKDIRARYNIPEEAFVIIFAGRHNEVKGFDLLKEFGTEILTRFNDVYFLNLGKENPIYGLKHERWIEVGWTDDPHSIINAGDLFALPNRETYFDLILLEVLALGKPILLSETGGNNFFADFKDCGFFFFANGAIEKMIAAFEKAYFLSKLERDSLEEKNRFLYAENFTITNFAKSYYKLLSNLSSSL